ncbi:MAG: hypothetical protein PHF86_12035 [Candidatus Nanoarchaeia archaeon]|nr:hypothetical protein [Candidatus Nanoarchaeia archaeon]
MKPIIKISLFMCLVLFIFAIILLVYLPEKESYEPTGNATNEFWISGHSHIYELRDLQWIINIPKKETEISFIITPAGNYFDIEFPKELKPEEIIMKNSDGNELVEEKDYKVYKNSDLIQIEGYNLSNFNETKVYIKLKGNSIKSKIFSFYPQADRVISTYSDLESVGRERIRFILGKGYLCDNPCIINKYGELPDRKLNSLIYTDTNGQLLIIEPEQGISEASNAKFYLYLKNIKKEYRKEIYIRFGVGILSALIIFFISSVLLEYYRDKQNDIKYNNLMKKIEIIKKSLTDKKNKK